jgi:hypothetical protein
MGGHCRTEGVPMETVRGKAGRHGRSTWDEKTDDPFELAERVLPVLGGVWKPLWGMHDSSMFAV